MKALTLSSALLALGSSIPSAIAGIAIAEYFIGPDPGPGNGVQIERPLAESAQFVVDIAPSLIAVLPDGIHWISGRVRDEAGGWSVAFTRPFRKATPAADTPQGIVAAEYFINDDPGPGNGARIPAPTAVNSAEFSIQVSPAEIAALPNGLHWITGRVLNQSGAWSVAFTRPFRKANPAPDPVKLMARVEYQWRLNGLPAVPPVVLAAGTPAPVIAFDFLASLQGLADGEVYQLVATPYDTAGTQGFSESTLVKIETKDQDGDGLPDLWELSNNIENGVDDTDGDGLTNLQEFLAKTNPRNRDSSGDGLSDGFAVSLGLDPLRSYPAMRGAMIAHSQELGLAREDQVRFLNGGGPVMDRDPQTGKFTVRIGLAEAAAIGGPWTPVPILEAGAEVRDGWLEYSFMSNEDVMFYRVATGE